MAAGPCHQPAKCNRSPPGEEPAQSSVQAPPQAAALISNSLHYERDFEDPPPMPYVSPDDLLSVCAQRRFPVVWPRFANPLACIVVLRVEGSVRLDLQVNQLNGGHGTVRLHVHCPDRIPQFCHLPL